MNPRPEIVESVRSLLLSVVVILAISSMAVPSLAHDALESDSVASAANDDPALATPEPHSWPDEPDAPPPSSDPGAATPFAGDPNPTTVATDSNDLDFDDQVSPASIVTDPPGGPTCSAPAGATRAAPGGFVRYTCAWNLPLATSGSFSAATSISGWQVTARRVPILNLIGGTTNGPGSTATVSGNTLATTYTVDVHVPSTATPGTAHITTISTTCSGVTCGNAAGTVSVSTTVDGAGYVNSVSANQYAELSCRPTPAGPWSVQQGGTTFINCTIGSRLNLQLLGLAALGLLELNITFPEGWGLTLHVPGSSPITATSGLILLSLDPLLDLAVVGGQTITLEVSVPCNAVPGAIAINTTLGVRVVLDLIAENGPQVNLPLATPETSNVLTGSFAGSDPLPFGPVPVSGLAGNGTSNTLDLQIARSSCAAGDANVQVSSAAGTSFAPVSPASGNIPLMNLTLSGVSAANPDGELTVIPPTSSVSITSPLTVASVSASSGTSNYEITLDLHLAVPAGVSPGVYEAVITLTFTPGGAP